MEQDEVHGDEGGHEMKMVKLQFGKEGIMIGAIFVLRSRHYRGCE
jgi:hypothetical protein